MERRLHTRHRAKTTVYITFPGKRGRICKAKNLSANGVFIETENFGLRKGQTVELAFAINLGTCHQDSPSYRCRRTCVTRRHRIDDGKLRRSVAACTRVPY